MSEQKSSKSFHLVSISGRALKRENQISLAKSVRGWKNPK